MASTVWRGYISFGLISIPVRLFRAARAERVSLRRLYRPSAEVEEGGDEEAGSRGGRPVKAPEPVPISTRGGVNGQEPENGRRGASAEMGAPRPGLTPLQQVSVRKGTDEVVADGSVVKGYEYEKGRYVALEPDELKSAVPKTSTTMEIEEFVQLDQIDPVYFETSYYVAPEEAGEKAYALLYRSMQSTRLVAVAQFAMHGRDHVVVLRAGKSGMLAHTMFFTSEVRAEEEYRTRTDTVAEKELKLAQTLIESLTAPFEPGKYKDTYRERLEAIIDRKVKGEPLPVTETAPRHAPVVDIAEALRKSLANLKKPASSDTRAASGGDHQPTARTKKASRARG